MLDVCLSALRARNRRSVSWVASATRIFSGQEKRARFFCHSACRWSRCCMSLIHEPRLEALPGSSKSRLAYCFARMVNRWLIIVRPCRHQKQNSACFVFGSWGGCQAKRRRYTGLRGRMKVGPGGPPGHTRLPRLTDYRASSGIDFEAEPAKNSLAC